MNNICSGFLKILNVLDFRDHFPKKSIFWNFRGQKPKILKNRDSHLVELLILRLLVFFICVFIKNCVFHRPAKFGQFSTKSGVWWRHKIDHISKKNPTDFKKFPRTMSNCCMRRPAKFHVDSAYSGGGGVKRPPVKRGLMLFRQHQLYWLFSVKIPAWRSRCIP